MGIQHGTPAGFFEQVLRLVQQVPLGRVTTYGALARMLGHPRGARMVGWALHALPASSGVPWQRVVNAQGRISLEELHGPSIQRKLLEAEGVEFDAGGRVDLKRFGWEGLPPHLIQRLVRD